ncbi:MAG: phosphoenolpyruvate--protein phosphotransferase [Treponemataceae bacterium]|nr:MAG: phosphoenolpyruvate--protein phosphotransferase [Treponemataceae bacterium]
MRNFPMQIFSGTSVSEGYFSGKAFVIPDDHKRVIPKIKVSPDEIETNWERFLRAKERVRANLLDAMSVAKKEQKQILEVHLLMLDDSIFLTSLETQLRETKFCIEYCLDKYVDEFLKPLLAADDADLRQRSDDIKDVYDAVLLDLLGCKDFDYATVPPNAAVIASNITPSAAIKMFSASGASGARDASNAQSNAPVNGSNKGARALCLANGGAGSHVGILSRNARIPAVFALPQIHEKIKTGDEVIVDGTEGKLYLHPDDETKLRFGKLVKSDAAEKKSMSKFITQEARTKDGKRIMLYANIGSPDEAAAAQQEGADGIGLFRTEFLFMNEDVAVSEEVQFEAYKKVLQTMQGKPVTIRTLDAGGDKAIKNLDVEKSENPLLGERAVRLTLNRPELYKTQLRALYRASVFGNLKIMIPLITHAEQIAQTKLLAQEVMRDLQKNNIAHNADVPLGIMVETAAAAEISDVLSKTSDFFSLGTNDLTQYTLAVDRENKNVAELFSEFHLAVLRFIKKTADAAHNAHIPVSVCGEMASSKEGALLLAGLGITELSMSSAKITQTKKLLAEYTADDLAKIAQKAFSF